MNIKACPPLRSAPFDSEGIRDRSDCRDGRIAQVTDGLLDISAGCEEELINFNAIDCHNDSFTADGSSLTTHI